MESLAFTILMIVNVVVLLVIMMVVIRINTIVTRTLIGPEEQDAPNKTTFVPARGDEAFMAYVGEDGLYSFDNQAKQKIKDAELRSIEKKIEGEFDNG